MVLDFAEVMKDNDCMKGESGQLIDGFVHSPSILLGGVYALTWAGEIVYIGRTNRFLVRLYAHQQAKLRKGRLRRTGPGYMRFDNVQLFPCSEDASVAVEAQLILKHAPRYNERLRGKTKERLELVVNGTKLVLNDRRRPKARANVGSTWGAHLRPPAPKITRRVVVQSQAVA